MHWPLPDFSRSAASASDPDFKKALSRGRYSIRMLRYWWAAHAIADLSRQAGRRLVVVDLGCGNGWLKRVADEIVDAEWIGIDGRPDEALLREVGYSQVIAADFEKGVNLPTASADVVVSLHVFEHLHSAERAMSEVRRILVPNGAFLAGTPTMPAPLAGIRTAWHQFRHRIGKPTPNGHARSFSPLSWQRLLNRHGFDVGFMTGSHWIRLSGSKLESMSWWIRANQFCGSLIPSLGSEVYLLAVRNPLSNPAAASVSKTLWRMGDWALPATIAAAGVTQMLPH